MSYPADPLDVVVEIAPGSDPGSDPNDFDWVDISEWWRVGDPITISRGKSSPLSDTVPSQCSLTLDNADGRFASRNPISPYYPDLARNTPLRVRLRQAYDEFDRTASSSWGTAPSGQVWTTTGGSASDYSVADGVGKHSIGTTGVLRHSLIDTGLTNHTISVDVTLPVVPTGAAYTLWVVVRAADTSNYYHARLTIAATTGATTLILAKRVAGALTDLSSSVSVGTHTAGQTWRVVVDVAGSRLRGKAWKTSESDPGWLAEATDTALTAGTLAGVLTRAEAGNTNGTQVVTWDNLDVSSVRFTGYVDKWPPRWDPSGNNRWVPIVAHGTLRRISTAGDATRSALYRYLTEQSWTRIAYWPMEDGSDATEAAAFRDEDYQAPNLAPSAPVRFGTAAPSSSGVSAMLDPSGAYLHARLQQFYALTWRLEVVVAHDTVPGGTVRVLSWLCPGTVTRWDVNATAAGYELVGWTAVSGGTTVATVSSGFIPQPGALHHIRVDISHTGTTDCAATLYIDGVNEGTDTATGLHAHLPTVIRVNPDADDTDNLPLVGHLVMWGEHPANSESYQVALGYPGEQAHERIEAVCGERSVPYAAYSSSLSSDTMGPRLSGSLVSQLRDPETTDAGILYELTSGHLSYRPRSTLYNQTVAVTLDYDAGHVTPPFEPSDDDAQLRNDVSARRPSGSEYRYTDPEHIAAVGRYETSLSVNPESDETLPQLAAWAVHRGTVTEQRFDTIATSLYRASSLIGDWLACDIGDRIQVDNVPSHLTPDAVDVILAGYTETFRYPSVWRVEMVCEPASAWMIGELDDTVLGRLDTGGSSLATGNTSEEVRGDSDDTVIVNSGSAALFAVGQRVVLHGPDGRRKESTTFTITQIDPEAFGFVVMHVDPLPAEPVRGAFSGGFDTIRRVDQTSLSVSTSTGPVWTTNAGHVPFDINIGGERMTVTAISGATSPQTFTVTRAVNGVEKHHSAGASVRLWQPLTLGL